VRPPMGHANNHVAFVRVRVCPRLGLDSTRPGHTVAKMAYTDLPGSRCFLNPRKCAKGPAAQAPVPPPLILLQLLRRAAAQEVGTW
jgi:hypothetical protein